MTETNKPFELAQLRAAEVTFIMREPFQQMEGEPLKAVHELVVEGCLIKYFFIGTEHALLIAADVNDDTVEVHLTSPDKLPVTVKNVSAVDPWKSLIGRSFGWCSMTINQQGYCDGVLMSFDGVFPQVFLTVIASSIKLGRITM